MHFMNTFAFTINDNDQHELSEFIPVKLTNLISIYSDSEFYIYGTNENAAGIEIDTKQFTSSYLPEAIDVSKWKIKGQGNYTIEMYV